MTAVPEVPEEGLTGRVAGWKVGEAFLVVTKSVFCIRAQQGFWSFPLTMATQLLLVHIGRETLIGAHVAGTRLTSISPGLCPKN